MALDFDRVKASIASLVRSALSRVDYMALYACKVASQNSDGTLELTPDDNGRVPGMSNVKYKPGIPGAVVTVSSGTRVLLGFENGDPAKPYAIGWDLNEGSVTELDVTASTVKLNSGSAGVARNGDTVDIGSFAAVGTNFQWTPPGGGSPVTLFTLVPGSGGASLTPGSPNGNGKINQGSSSVKCG